MAKPTQTLKKAVFLDRDGVLNHDSGYVFRIEDLKLMPGVPAALSDLKAHGYLLVVITNQSGVARGLYGMDDVEVFHKNLRAEILKHGGPELDGIYTCPHHPDGSVAQFALTCDCRKPAPGLLLSAANDLHIDFQTSWMIGDKDSDAGAARAVGVKSVLIQSTKYHQSDRSSPVVGDIVEAARLILASK